MLSSVFSHMLCMGYAVSGQYSYQTGTTSTNHNNVCLLQHVKHKFLITFYKTDTNRTSGKIKLTPPVDSKTDTNRTSGKIKLTPPVDSYTIILLGLTLGIAQISQG